tara:strand:+ start:56 stop:262 length:207 start_codon:yes stop_codon:yes gene_type:complete
MVSLIANPVENYYREHSGKNLSLKKVSKKLGIKFREGVFLVNKSNVLKKVIPLQVGCGKKHMLLFRFD